MQGDFEDRLRSVFKRVFRTEVGSGGATVEEIEEWDSLTHIKLVMELESEFDINIEPDEILPLYSNFSTISDFLKKIEGR
ncbi:MAG: acyl carrier protein [Thermodesulfobacteriota bacterium]